MSNQARIIKLMILYLKSIKRYTVYLTYLKMRDLLYVLEM